MADSRRSKSEQKSWMDRLLALDYSSYPRLTRFVCKWSRISLVIILIELSLLESYLARQAVRAAQIGDENKRQQERQQETRTEQMLDHHSSWHRLPPYQSPLEDLSEHLKQSRLIRRVCKWYNLLLAGLHLWCAGTAFISVLLDFESLAHFRRLACLLPGRFVVNGRACGGAKYAALFMCSLFAFIRLCAIIKRPLFQIQVVEFVACGLHSLMANNRRLDSKRSKISIEICKQDPKMLAHELNEDGLCTDEFMLVKNGSSTGDQRVPKLNRSSRIWWWLNAGLAIHCFVFIIIIFVFWFPLIGWLQMPTLLTRRGYELSYPNCVDHLRQFAQNNWTRAQEYSHIYLPTKLLIGNSTRLQFGTNNRTDLPICLPFEDLLTLWSRYHLIRIPMDVFQTTFVYTDIILFVYTNFALTALMSMDIVINAEILKRQLLSLKNDYIADGTQRRNSLTCQSRSLLKRNYDFYRHLMTIERQRECDCFCCNQPQVGTRLAQLDGRQSRLKETARTIRTIRLQTLVLDQLSQTIKYNEYISMLCLIVIVTGLTYSCSIIAWSGVAGRDEVSPEMLIAIVLTEVAIIFYLYILSFVRHWNLQLYPIITSLMSLKDDQSITNQRWMVIVNCFHPKPLFSFSIISAEISYLLLIKIVAWTFSALFVVVNFSYVRRAIA